ncbi:MAG TPA: D-glucuronyl C5-epimerase family protein, partial [Ktedonobacteraceae bacterium]|nr:D-glucuronyl C5-epimerase family protein [Ktedonobacteraceae bacterium]
MTQLLPYPIELSPYLAAWRFSLDAAGVPTRSNTILYHPTLIAQYALLQWRRYLAGQDERDKSAFLAQVRWLVAHETRIADDAGGWPISSLSPHTFVEGSWLSATTQGNALSGLVRAYQLTQETQFLKCAHRVAQTFARDILDGGVASPIGKEGLFFEDVAIYPASHSFSGCVFALSGLYDYVTLTGNGAMREVIERGLSTMHTLLAEFDTGFWAYSDLLDRPLVSPPQLLLQAELLAMLATLSGRRDFLAYSLRWRHYHHQRLTRLRYRVAQYKAHYSHILGKRIRARFFPVPQMSTPLQVCIPITAFPVAGGMRAVLSSLMQVTAESWRADYVTQYKGPNASDFTIYTFGTARMSPWQFPIV